MSGNTLETLQGSRSRLSTTVRRLLSPSFQGLEEAVPQPLVDAVVDGKGDRGAVEEQTREAFGDEPALEVVLFDTDRIGEYVFESSRPPVIQGASSILRELNSSVRKTYEDFTVFSGGGQGLLLVPNGCGAVICREIEDRYRRATSEALGVTTGWIAARPSAFIERELPDLGNGETSPAEAELVSGTGALLAQLRDQVRLLKDSRLPDAQPVPGGQKRCLSCRDRAGTIDAEDMREKLRGAFLCRPCEQRWRQGRKEIAGLSLEELVEAFHGDDDGRGKKERYVGFVYTDGNAMGDLFGRLRSLAELRFLSQAVEHVFQQVKERAEANLQATSPGAFQDDSRKPTFLSFLGGGDEAVWILPAGPAVATAHRLPAWVEQEAAQIEDLQDLLQRAGLRTLTIGTGLVVCDYRFPVRYQFELARELQKNAKTLFYGAAPGEAGSALDFEILTNGSPSSVSLEQARSLTYRTEDPDFLRTCRPYSAAAFEELVLTVGAAGATRLGKSQLFALQSGAAEGKAVFLNYLLYQIARNRKRYTPWLEARGVTLTLPGSLEAFFVRSTPGSGDREATWIPDALQLAPFVDAGFAED